MILLSFDILAPLVPLTLNFNAEFCHSTENRVSYVEKTLILAVYEIKNNFILYSVYYSMLFSSLFNAIVSIRNGQHLHSKYS